MDILYVYIDELYVHLQIDSICIDSVYIHILSKEV